MGGKSRPDSDSLLTESDSESDSRPLNKIESYESPPTESSPSADEEKGNVGLFKYSISIYLVLLLLTSRVYSRSVQFRKLRRNHLQCSYWILIVCSKVYVNLIARVTYK